MEGAWEGLGAASVAEWLVEIEEEGLHAVKEAKDVPIGRRVRFVRTEARLDRKEVLVKAYGEPDGVEEGWTVRSQVVSF